MEVLVFQASNYKVHDEPSNKLEAFPLVFSLRGRSDPLRRAGDFQRDFGNVYYLDLPNKSGSNQSLAVCFLLLPCPLA